MWQIAETLRALFKEFESLYGRLNFVVLIPNRGDPNLIDILVCASWFPASDKETVNFLVQTVTNRLSKNDLLQISSIIPIRDDSPLKQSPELLEHTISRYFDLSVDQIVILLPENAQVILGVDGQYHPRGYFLGTDGQYHAPGTFLGTDGRYHPQGSFLGTDGQYHPQSSFLGTDGQYHPRGSFLGTDGRYHPTGSYLGLDGTYVEPADNS